MTSTSKRYLVVKNPTLLTTTQLEERNFIPLKSAVHKERQHETMIFVDTKTRNFWKVDSVSLKNAEEIVRDSFDDNIKTIESEQLNEVL